MVLKVVVGSQMGANIGMENVYGEVPINHILPETMENHLNSCLASKGNVTNDNFEITARFDFLSPPTDPDCTRKNPSWTGRLDLEENDAKGEEEVKQYLPETEGLWHMSQSKKHQHLLKHPVIALFLWLKWKRMGAAYNRCGQRVLLSLLYFLALTPVVKKKVT